MLGLGPCEKWENEIAQIATERVKMGEKQLVLYLTHASRVSGREGISRQLSSMAGVSKLQASRSHALKLSEFCSKPNIATHSPCIPHAFPGISAFSL